jgi:hypothetical protein
MICGEPTSYEASHYAVIIKKVEFLMGVDSRIRQN